MPGPTFPGSGSGAMLNPNPVWPFWVAQLQSPAAPVTTTPVSSSLDFAIEALAGIQAALDLPLEASGQVAVSSVGVLPIESLTGVLTALTEPLDVLQGISSSFSISVESTQGISSSSALIIESFAGIASASQMPIDEAGQIAVVTTSLFPLDVLSGVAAALGLPIEAFKTGIAASASAPVETLKSGIAAVVAMPIDSFRGGITQTAVLALDLGQSVAAIAILPVEAVLPTGFFQPGTLIVSDSSGVVLVVEDAESGSAALSSGRGGLVVADGLLAR